MDQIKAQAIFDVALFGIRQQGGAAVSPGGNCQFRVLEGTYKGRRCAIGWTMTDAEIEMADSWKWPDRIKKGSDEFPLLDDLRTAHNSAARKPDFFSQWEADMKVVAEVHGLRYAPPLDAGFKEFLGRLEKLEREPAVLEAVTLK